MITKKLSAVDRLTLATGAVEKINDTIKSKRKIFLEELNNSKNFIEEGERLEEIVQKDKQRYLQLEEKIKELEEEQKDLKDYIINNSSVHLGSWEVRNLTQAEINSKLKEGIKKKLCNKYLVEANLKEPLDDSKIRSLINKGQSLILLSENQDPNDVDKMLMEELIKQI